MRRKVMYFWGIIMLLFQYWLDYCFVFIMSCSSNLPTVIMRPFRELFLLIVISTNKDMNTKH